jgi:hypothetical protein
MRGIQVVKVPSAKASRVLVMRYAFTTSEKGIQNAMVCGTIILDFLAISPLDMSAASRLVPVFLDRDTLLSCCMSTDIVTCHEWGLYSVMRSSFLCWTRLCLFVVVMLLIVRVLHVVCSYVVPFFCV